MEDTSDSPRAVRVEEHPRGVVLTYFQGDINSMVDAHFSRALSKTCRAKAPLAKPKRIRKTIKLEDTSSYQSAAAATAAADSYIEPQALSASGRLLTFSHAMEPAPPGSWHSLGGRPGEGPGLPPLAYSLSPQGLSLTGQEYATSLLNLLHSDRSEMGPGAASGSKPELVPSWTLPSGFRESVDPAVGFEPERRMDKKDLYWY